MSELLNQIGYRYKVEPSLALPGMTYIHLYIPYWDFHKQIIWQIRL